MYDWGRIIADTGIKPPGLLPAGFLTASAEDMSHYLIAQLNGGRYGESAVLSATGIATLHRPAAPAFSSESAYGLGWVIGPTNGVNTIWHNGDDTRNRAWVLLTPDSQWGVVLLANATGFELAVGADEIAKGVLNLVLDQPPPTPSILRAIIKGVYWIVLLTPLLEILGIGWGVRQLLRWRKRVAAGEVRWGWLRLGWGALGPILPNLLVALLFLWGLPQYTGLPMTGIVRLIPGFGAALMMGGLLAIGWSIARTLWLWLTLRMVQQRPVDGRSIASASA
jgi:hypothetical protein